MYPQAPRGSVVDTYGSTQVADPYRWLEQLDSDATKQWVKAENAVSQPRLESLPDRSDAPVVCVRAGPGRAGSIVVHLVIHFLGAQVRARLQFQ